MSRKKRAVNLPEAHTLNFKVPAAEGEVLNEMARITGIAKSSILRNALYEALAKWQGRAKQERGI